MAPTQQAPVVRRHPETGERRLDLLRWGLVPHFVKDPGDTHQPFNARSETAASAPLFRSAMRHRRCLVPADAFYEWRAGPDGKQPFAVARADGSVMTLAGLWEGWRGADGTVLRTYTILTTQACAQLAPLHERMAVVLEPDDWPVWLGESNGDPTALLHPSQATFRIWPVSPRVGNVRNNDAGLLEPISLDPETSPAPEPPPG